MSLIAPAYAATEVVRDIRNYGVNAFPMLILVWVLVASVLLVLGSIGARKGWKTGAQLSLTGLAMIAVPAALLLIFVLGYAIDPPATD